MGRIFRQLTITDRRKIEKMYLSGEKAKDAEVHQKLLFKQLHLWYNGRCWKKYDNEYLYRSEN